MFLIESDLHRYFSRHSYYNEHLETIVLIGSAAAFPLQPLCYRKSCRFEPHQGPGVVSLSKTLHLHCLVLVQPEKTSQHDRKIVDWDVKPQPKQNFAKKNYNLGLCGHTDV